MRTTLAILRTPSGAISALILLAVLIAVLFGEQLAPYDPLDQDPNVILHGPSVEHWLGTDYAGSRLSVLAALQALVIGLVLGVIPAFASVYGGRGLEWVLLRIMDSFMALPFITFAIAMSALLGNGLVPAMTAVGILIAPGFFRITRGAVLDLDATQYVEAARLFGHSTPRVIMDHVARKVAPTVLVTSAGLFASSLVVVASLTFLGIGVQPPAPTWGGVLASDLGYLSQRPLGPVPAALVIMATVAAIGILADHVRDRTAIGSRRSLYRRVARPGTDADTPEEAVR
jgi:peptide/nickel transport system permease protein